jgi:Zn-dependent peptidase ImmA (M78 family)
MSGVTARNAAKKVFAEFFSDVNKIDLKKIAKAWGLEIYPEPLDGELSGIIIVDDSKKAIVINSKDSKERQTFTIAHELGHFHLHKPTGVIVDNDSNLKSFSMNRDPNSKLGKNVQEIEANQFAAELLMPEEFLIKDANNFPEGLGDKAIEELSKKYSVSNNAMHVRLASLKLI